jgi:hypothetical protein
MCYNSGQHDGVPAERSPRHVHAIACTTDLMEQPRVSRMSVAAGCEGRHAFDSIRLPEVAVAQGLDAVAAPDLVVFPCSQYRRYEHLASTALPGPLRTRIREGHAGVVLDSSLEGVPHKPDVAAALHALLDRLGVPPARCVVLTQDRQYEASYRAHCAAVGLEPVGVLTHDYWLWDALSRFADNGEEAYAERLAAFRGRETRRARRFVSLNRTPRPTKILFLLRLLHDGLWSEAFISFGGFRAGETGPGKPRPTPDQLAGSLPGFEDLVALVAPQLDTLAGYGRVLFGLERQGWRRLEMGDSGIAGHFEEMDRSWFTAVTETEMRRAPSRITEKVLKPLVNFHPLVLFGNPGGLEMIRDYGFATFAPLVDEAYDEEPEPRRRFDLAYAEVVRLCRMRDDELACWEAAMAERLAYNARWGLTRFPTIFRDRCDRALLDRIRLGTLLP